MPVACSNPARAAYPLIQVLARALAGERTVLLGNAAQTIHPLGAQGFNLGLRDALTLAELLEDAQDDAGSDALLQAYVARRETTAGRRWRSPADWRV